MAADKDQKNQTGMGAGLLTGLQGAAEQIQEVIGKLQAVVDGIQGSQGGAGKGESLREGSPQSQNGQTASPEAEPDASDGQNAPEGESQGGVDAVAEQLRTIVEQLQSAQGGQGGQGSDD